MHPFHITSGHGYFIVLAILFILLNAFFVAAEFALVKMRQTRLKVLADEGNRLAKLAFGMSKNLDAYLSATQLGITLASLGLGWIGEPAFSILIKKGLQWFDLGLDPQTIHSLGFTTAFLFISALHIIFGELVPKSLAIQVTEKVCLIIAIPLRVFYLVFFPFLWGLNGISNFFLSFLKLPPTGHASHAHSEEELKLVVEDSYVGGEIESDQRTLLNKAIDFSSKTVADIMVPLAKVVFLDIRFDLSQNLDIAKEAGHTRFPLKLNSEGHVTGFVHIKDVIWSLEHDHIINLFDLQRPLLVFKPDVNIDEALKQFKRKKVHMALIRKFGGELVGILTLEDVIEELVGEIEDEFDEEEKVQQIS